MQHWIRSKVHCLTTIFLILALSSVSSCESTPLRRRTNIPDLNASPPLEDTEIPTYTSLSLDRSDFSHTQSHTSPLARSCGSNEGLATEKNRIIQEYGKIRKKFFFLPKIEANLINTLHRAPFRPFSETLNYSRSLLRAQRVPMTRQEAYYFLRFHGFEPSEPYCEMDFWEATSSQDREQELQEEDSESTMLWSRPLLIELRKRLLKMHEMSIPDKRRYARKFLNDNGFPGPNTNRIKQLFSRHSLGRVLRPFPEEVKNYSLDKSLHVATLAKEAEEIVKSSQNLKTSEIVPILQSHYSSRGFDLGEKNARYLVYRIRKKLHIQRSYTKHSTESAKDQAHSV